MESRSKARFAFPIPMKPLSQSLWILALTGALALGASAQPNAPTQANAPAQLNVAQINVAVAASGLRVPRGVSLSDISAHQMRPANLIGATSFSYDGPRLKELKPPKAFESASPQLNTLAMLNNVDKALEGRVAGYAIAVQRGLIGIGKPKLLVKRDYSRRTGDGKLDWDQHTRMHIASVSKMLTAMAVTKALRDKGLSLDTTISGYLPTYWSKGANIDKITFRHLLTQTSGFHSGASDSDFGFMKSKVAAGVTTTGSDAIGTYDYENMNTGLCRILLPVLLGKISKSQNFNGVSTPTKDAIWDGFTINYYREWVQDAILTPSGVSEAGFKPTPGVTGALAYSFPPGNTGWNSGNLNTMAGGVGWRLSIAELLDVMSTWADTNSILPKTAAKTHLDAGLGLDVIADTPIGRMYSKNGLWQNNGRREQCIAYFLPQNLQLVVFVNSGVGADSEFLRSIIDKAFLDAIK